MLQSILQAQHLILIFTGSNKTKPLIITAFRFLLLVSSCWLKFLRFLQPEILVMGKIFRISSKSQTCIPISMGLKFYNGKTARIISARQGEPLVDIKLPVSELKSKTVKVYPNGSESDSQPLKPFDVKLFDYQVDTTWQYNQPIRLFAI